MKEKNITIGVDIGGSHILSAAIDTTKGTILQASKAHLKIDNKASKDKVIDQWAKALNQTLEQINRERLTGIGFAMPGAFNYKEGIAMFKGNNKYEALYQVNVMEELSKRLKVQNIPMRFLNDATSFAVGVAWLGKAKGRKKVIAITLGTGFGSAYIENGWPIVNREDVADQGCFWHLPYLEGIADDYFSTRWFINAYEKLTGKKMPGVKPIADLARNDASVKIIFEQFGKHLGEFFSPWLKKFPADIIVMGGNITGAFDLFSEAFEATLNKEKINTTIAVSQLMEDAALIGSARLFETAFWQKIKDDLPSI